jgi:hypothetical protein
VRVNGHVTPISGVRRVLVKRIMRTLRHMWRRIANG